MKLLPEHGPCYVCGTENPKSMGTRWYLMPDGSVEAEMTLTVEQQGPPGHAHGGASAALIDEAMGAAVWQAGHMVVAANLTLDYRHPLPLGVKVKIVGQVAEVEAHKIHARGEIRLPNGQIAVVGRGIFVEAKHLFEPLAGERDTHKSAWASYRE